MNNIYNVTAYDVLTNYSKNDIITFNDSISNIPITNGFLYCLTSTNGAFDIAKWDGYIQDPPNSSSQIKPKFLWTPNYQSKVDNKPAIRKLQFGDSYESRMSDGINNNLLLYDVEFNNRTIDEITAITHFLTQRNAAESFVFFGRLPYYRQLRFVCEEWSDTEEFANNFSLKAQFRQVVN